MGVEKFAERSDLQRSRKEPPLSQRHADLTELLELEFVLDSLRDQRRRLVLCGDREATPR